MAGWTRYINLPERNGNSAFSKDVWMRMANGAIWKGFYDYNRSRWDFLLPDGDREAISVYEACGNVIEWQYVKKSR